MKTMIIFPIFDLSLYSLFIFFVFFALIIFIVKYFLLRNKYKRYENIPFSGGRKIYFNKFDFFIDININIKSLDYPNVLIKKISPNFSLVGLEDYATIFGSKCRDGNIRIYFISINNYLNTSKKKISEIKKIFKRHKLISDPWLFLYLIAEKQEIKEYVEIKFLWEETKITKDYFIFSFFKSVILKERTKKDDIGYITEIKEKLDTPVYIMGIKK